MCGRYSLTKAELKAKGLPLFEAISEVHLTPRFNVAPTQGMPIITTQPNELVALVHDRMPVILPSGALGSWLDPLEHDKARLMSMLMPYPAELMTGRPVSSRVNSVKNDDAEVLV
jgi:putative SOS response-associated peptidase YedK